MISLVPLVVLIPLVGAAITLAVPSHRTLQRFITLVSLAAVSVIGLVLMVVVDRSGPLVMQVGGWAAPFGISLVVDRVSALMLVVSAVVLLAVFLFSIGQGLADGDEETPVSIYYPTYLVLGAGVFNAFIAGDLFNLYVGFEILLVASYVLITLGGTASRIKAGVTYVVVSLVSSILFLAAIGLIYGATGTVNMAQLSLRIAELPQDLQLILNLVLLIAFGIKAAVFPLAFWLPDSYPTAPAPVTAVFAGLLTKVGVYAIIRTQTLLFPHSSVDPLLLVVAALTLIVGILGAVSQLDIKRMLSFTLISHIGYMIFGIAIATAAGFAATVYYIVHHIIVQTTLFLAVGLVERQGGTTSLTGLGGLLRSAPVVGVLFFIPMLSLGGIPPFSGFLGKLGLFVAGAEVGTAGTYWLIGIGAFVSLLTLYALARTWVLAFWRPVPRPVGATSGVVPETAPVHTVEVKAAPTSESLIAHEREMAMFERLQEAPEVLPKQEKKGIPKLMIAATAGMLATGLVLTFAGGPLFAYAERAGVDLAAPGELISTVLDAEHEDGGSGTTKPLDDSTTETTGEESHG